MQRSSTDRPRGRRQRRSGGRSGPVSTPRRSLPDEVTLRPLSRPAAWGRGVTDHELAGPLWSAPLQGVHQWSGLDGEDPLVRIHAAALLLPPGAAIGGWAALRLLGAIDLDGGADLGVRRLSRPPRRADGRRPAAAPLTPILICLGPSARIRPRPEIDISRARLPTGDVTVVDGVPVTVGARAFIELARQQSVENAVVSFDAGLRSGALTHDAVTSRLLAAPGHRDAQHLDRVLALADGRARSGPESRFRLIWRSAGLGRPLVNVEVFDGRGHLIAIPDLLDPLSGLVGEYDGAGHRSLSQHTEDNAREERLEDHNLVVVRASALDLWRDRDQLVRRLRSGRERALARDRSRDDWRIAT